MRNRREMDDDHKLCAIFAWIFLCEIWIDMLATLLVVLVLQIGILAAYDLSHDIAVSSHRRTSMCIRKYCLVRYSSAIVSTRNKTCQLFGNRTGMRRPAVVIRVVCESFAQWRCENSFTQNVRKPKWPTRMETYYGLDASSLVFNTIASANARRQTLIYGYNDRPHGFAKRSHTADEFEKRTQKP